MCVVTAGVGISAMAALSANVSIGTAIAGTVLQVYGSYQQSKAQKGAAEYNAQVAENNAKVAEWNAADAIDRGRIEEQEHRRKVSAFKGTQRAQLASSGFDINEGGAVDILADTAEFGELDALTIRSNAEREAYRARVLGSNFQAQSGLYQAQADSTNPFLSAGTALFSGAGSVADRWYRSTAGAPRVR